MNSNDGNRSASPSQMKKLRKINYSELNSLQKETYNFQKIAGILADYGFNCIWLNDDWQGADFLAYLTTQEETMKIQLKARLTIDKKYINKDLYIAYPIDRKWYIVKHDVLVDRLKNAGIYTGSKSWIDNGNYSIDRPGKDVLDILDEINVIDNDDQV